jgi:hypothetical protein
MPTVALRIVITDIGRQYYSRFLARQVDWSAQGYRLFNTVRWGEGGWETVMGTDIARDPSAMLGNNDLDIITNPGLYPGYGYATPSPGLPINQTSQSLWVGTAQAIHRVIAALDSSQETDDGSGNPPRLFELGVFDNAFDNPFVQGETGVTKNNLILYATFEGFLKTVGREVAANLDVPFAP